MGNLTPTGPRLGAFVEAVSIILAWRHRAAAVDVRTLFVLIIGFARDCLGESIEEEGNYAARLKRNVIIALVTIELRLKLHDRRVIFLRPFTQAL